MRWNGLREVRLLSVKLTTVKPTQMRWKWFTVLWFYLDGLWCLVLWSLRCICVPDRSSSGCSNTRRCCRTTLTERRGRNTDELSDYRTVFEPIPNLKASYETIKNHSFVRIRVCVCVCVCVCVRLGILPGTYPSTCMADMNFLQASSYLPSW